MAHPSRVNVGSYRTLFPFFLIIAVILLLIWRLILSPGLSTPAKKCPEGTSSYWVQPGDNCWEVSRQHGWTMDKFKEANPKVVCDPLMPGTSLCLPPLKDAPERRLRLWWRISIIILWIVLTIDRRTPLTCATYFYDHATYLIRMTSPHNLLACVLFSLAMCKEKPCV